MNEIIAVLEIYRITLLSNSSRICERNYLCFGDLQNYTTLKRVLPQYHYIQSFGDLQNYTTLKLLLGVLTSIACFGDLQNYTTLKPGQRFKCPRFSFGDLQNYTTLKQPTQVEDRYTCFGDLQNYTTLKPQIRVWGSKATRATTRCNFVNTLNQTKIFI